MGVKNNMKTLISIAQMTSVSDKKENLKACQKLIELAYAKGAKILAFPENFAYFSEGGADILKAAEYLDGPTIAFFQKQAQKHQIWLFLGGFAEKILKEEKVFNSHVVIDNNGEIKAVYHKINLFCAKLPCGSIYDEASFVKAGNKTQVVKTPYFIAGLSICRDIRFPKLFAKLSSDGAQVLFIPAAFTYTTGQHHWEILLRARAIENQCYVVAPAQIGQHSPKRRTWGHAMIISPWGDILGHCKETDNLAFAQVDLDYFENIRKNMPINN